LEQQRAAAADARALAFAKLDPFQQANFAIGRGASGLAGALGGALGGQDPELQRVTMRQQLLGTIDPSRPETFDLAAQAAEQAGDTQLAFGLRLEAPKYREQARIAQDQEQARKDKLLAKQQQARAEEIARLAFNPGEPTLYGKPTPFPTVDEEGNLMPGAGMSQPSYDINRVAPQLMALGTAGQNVLSSAVKVNEEMARAQKLTAEAQTAAQEALFAGPAKQAAAQKLVADAQTATVNANFAERLQIAGLNKTNWDTANVQSQIKDRAARLNLDAQTTAATVAEKLASRSSLLTQLPADTRKLVNESATLAVTSKQSANQMNDLANRIEGLGGYGTFSRLSEFAKGTIGAEGYETSLRQEYTRIRNSQAIKSLPPGPATDADIQLALSGFPKNTSDSKLVARFLRGMAKLQDIDAAVSNAKTDWLAQNNGTLTRAGKTFVAGDFTARPGESWIDFSTRVAKEVNDQYSRASTGASTSEIPGGNETPIRRQPQPSIMNQADAILQRGR
jgi:hypothetical protein